MAAIITGYSVSGTYAKYVSSIDVADTARVAKWDITNATEASQVLFKASYDNADGAEIIKANDNTDVVAPGAGNKAIIKITGAPETNYTLTANYHIEANGDAADATNGFSYNTVVDGDYNPLRFRVTSNKTGGTYTNKWVTFENLYKAIDEVLGTDRADSNNSKVYEANTDIATVIGDITIEWKWAFDSAEATTLNVDAQDAFVSDDTKDTNIAKKMSDADANNDPKINLVLSILAEQSNKAAN